MVEHKGKLHCVDGIYGHIFSVEKMPTIDLEMERYLEKNPSTTIEDFLGVDQEIDRYLEHNETMMPLGQLLMKTKDEGSFLSKVVPRSRYGWEVYYYRH